ncbi:LacI family DNA-binding transcriptional regulator [Pseudoalteromonas sp. BDTF-M6]|uniref:LacI family DNA-binding transcriptional regulator n=1 Tax=Pseudoalteromonas sp. BDTF-M6 TaxID=2796132 RepID=UPI001BB08712|nr:LacI family DNA-binding transcriptional regulator [Pseudoalteromonas sp. BDTF-M6]MBS3797885.1 LacI family DNA-binding transcriptional regulator [Pseudoalteromonas sp. BDTF-M6]
MNSTPPHPKVTIIQVAEHAGVSKSTVSLVLTQPDKVSIKTKEKVRQAMAELGYVYNRDAAALRSKRSGLVAIMLPTLDNPKFTELATTLQQGVLERGFVPMLLSSNDELDTQQRLMERLKESNVTAVILCPATGTDVNWQNALNNSGMVIINVLREVPFSEAPCVLADTQRGAFLATQALLEQGCHSLALVGGSSLSNYAHFKEGFEQAVHLHPDTPSSQYIPCDNTRLAGQQALNDPALAKVLATVRADDGAAPVGLLCASDQLAYGVLDALPSHGLCAGKELKVVGFGDLPDSAFLPCPLSSVAYRSDDLAEHSLSILTALLNDQNVPRRTLIDVTLIKRASCL